MSDNPKNISLINLNAESIGDTAKEIYSDCLKPTAQATGQLLSLAPRGIRALLSPFEKWIINKEAALTETSQLVSKKLSSVSPEKIVSPEPYIAIPSLQALSYSIDNSDLRELFANLIASAMNKDTKDQAHPAFIEIIKQLSPLEAKILKKTDILSDLTPLCIISLKDNSECPEKKDDIFQEIPIGIVVVNHFVLFEEFEYENSEINIFSAAIDNFIRLGLSHIPYDSTIIDASLYNKFPQYVQKNNLFEYLKKAASYHVLENEFYCLSKNYTCPTDFGNIFYEICVK